MQSSYQKRGLEVDAFGKVRLKEDDFLLEVCNGKQAKDIPIYWEELGANSKLGISIRTARFKQAGYDVDKFRRSHVLIAGTGLLGSEVCQSLGAVGIGEFSLIDNGVVNWTDVFRQVLFARSDVGNEKVAVASEKLRDMGCIVRPYNLTIPSVVIEDVATAENAVKKLDDIIRDAELVVGVTDSFSTRAVLQMLCRRNGRIFISGAVDLVRDLGIGQGSVGVFATEASACYGCGTDGNRIDDQRGCTLAPIELAKIVGAIISGQVLNVLKSETPASSWHRVYDQWSIESSKIGSGGSDCELCELAQLVKSQPVEVVSREIVQWLLSI